MRTRRRGRRDGNGGVENTSGEGVVGVAAANMPPRDDRAVSPQRPGGGRRGFARGAGPRRRGTPGAAPRRRRAWWRSSLRPGESPRRFPGAGGGSGRHRGDAGAPGRARRRVRRAPSMPYLTSALSGSHGGRATSSAAPGPRHDASPPSGSGEEPVAPAETAASAVGAGTHARRRGTLMGPRAGPRRRGTPGAAPRQQGA